MKRFNKIFVGIFIAISSLLLSTFALPQNAPLEAVTAPASTSPDLNGGGGAKFLK